MQKIDDTMYPIIVKNAAGQNTFLIPAGYSKVVVFRDAGIIYEGTDPDEYTAQREGTDVRAVILNTALSANEILEINAYK